MTHCLKMIISLAIISCLNKYLADSASMSSTRSTSSAGTPNVVDGDHFNLYPNCGVIDTPQNVNTGRAINAVDARKQYRWVVLIERDVYNTIKKSNVIKYCSGSIITDRYELMS